MFLSDPDHDNQDKKTTGIRVDVFWVKLSGLPPKPCVQLSKPPRFLNLCPSIKDSCAIQISIFLLCSLMAWLTLVILATVSGVSWSFGYGRPSLSRIPSHFAKTPSSNEEKGPNEKNKFSFGGLVQLIMMGAGAPSLGEYKETDENGRMIFELEANNYVDSKGNVKQTQARFFTDGYIEDEFNERPPGFWANLMSGGKLQGEWDKKNSNSRNSRK